jgi:hypothetical protein
MHDNLYNNGNINNKKKGYFLFPSLPQSKPDKPSSFAQFTIITPNKFQLNKPCYVSKKMRDWSGLILGCEGMGK